MPFEPRFRPLPVYRRGFRRGFGIGFVPAYVRGFRRGIRGGYLVLSKKREITASIKRGNLYNGLASLYIILL